MPALTTGSPAHVMLSHLAGYHNQAGLTLETTLDPTQQPFLKDHAINGIPVLPGVMGIEGFFRRRPSHHLCSCRRPRRVGPSTVWKISISWRPSSSIATRPRTPDLESPAGA